MKELLLSNNCLTEEIAQKILKTWEKSPKMYYDFLRNQGASKRLEAYLGVSDEDSLGHQFLPIKTQIPSTKVAEKFFQLDDEDIIDDFLSVVNQLSKEKSNIAEICAWPYLEEKCTKYLSVRNIQKIITEWHYLFNFENDKNGHLFSWFYKQMDTDFWRDLLAANSVNLFGWVKTVSQYSFQKMSKHFWMAEHYMCAGLNFEAIGRKYYIRYRVDVEKLQYQYERSYYPNDSMCEN